MLLIQNVRRLLDTGDFEAIDVAIEGEKIVDLGHDLAGKYRSEDLDVLDGRGGLITPGLIDLHVHFRQPGQTEKETVATGSSAAARGGYTQVCAMPNLKPVPDTAERFEELQKINQQDGAISVHQYAPISVDLTSEEELTDFETLTALGAVAFTNDGVGVQTAGHMLRAMQAATKVDRPLVAHTEDNSLLEGGVMHRGKRSEELGLPGIYSATEASQIARDCVLAAEAGCHYHVCHISCKESVAVIRAAKANGVKVTCEVCPHHLILCDQDIPEDNGMWKMNPPLRGVDDRKALIEGLLDGTIDCIATDHAPHTQEHKDVSMLKAAFGIVGSEFAFASIYTHFVRPGIFTLQQVLDWMSVRPGKVFNLQTSAVEVGSIADLAIFDLEREYTIDAKDFLSKSFNTPFIGHKVYGPTHATIYHGQVVYQEK